MANTGEIDNLIAAARSGTANIKPLALKMRGQGQVFVAEALERLQDCVLSLSRALTSTVQLSTSPIGSGELEPGMAIQPGDVLTTAGIFDGSITIRAIADAASGARRVMLDVVASPPANLGSFAGVLAFAETTDAIAPQGRYPYTGTHPAAWTISLGPYETKQAPESWTIYLVSYSSLVDKQLDLATGGTPRRGVSVTATAGLDGAHIAAATLQTAAFATTIRPVTLGSSNPSLPDALYPAGIGIIYNTTDYTLYKVNAAGTAWVKLVNGGTDIQAGTITGDRLYANTITAGQIAAGAIGTAQLVAGEILVGAAGGKPTKFTVHNSASQVIGFIGYDSGVPYEGAFFVNLRVGANIATPTISASVSGVTIDGAKLIVSAPSIGTTLTVDPASATAALLIASTTTPYPGIAIGGITDSHPYIHLYSNTSTYYPRSLAAFNKFGVYYAAAGPSAVLDAFSTQAGLYLYYDASHQINIFTVSATGGTYISVTGGSYKIGSTDVINSDGAFVGAGTNHTGYPVSASGFNPYSGSTQYTGLATISQAFVTTPTTVLLRTNAGDLEYSSNGGVNWYSVGTGGIVLHSGYSTKTITGYGGVITSIA